MKYTGPLSKPISRKPIGLLLTDEQLSAVAESLVKERMAKLPLLAEAHGVTEGDWFALAFKLACTHVPGFKLANPPGRPTEWSDVDKAELRIDVDDYISGKPATSVAAAIRSVIRQKRWVELTKNKKIDAISKHYYGADERWVEVVRNARAFDLIKPSD